VNNVNENSNNAPAKKVGSFTSGIVTAIELSFWLLLMAVGFFFEAPDKEET